MRQENPGRRACRRTPDALRTHAERVEQRRFRLRQQRVQLALLDDAAQVTHAAGDRHDQTEARRGDRPNNTSTSSSRQPRRVGTRGISTHQNTKNTALLSTMNSACITNAPRSANTAFRFVANSARAKRHVAARVVVGRRHVILRSSGACVAARTKQAMRGRGTIADAPEHQIPQRATVRRRRRRRRMKTPVRRAVLETASARRCAASTPDRATSGSIRPPRTKSSFCADPEAAATRRGARRPVSPIRT